MSSSTNSTAQANGPVANAVRRRAMLAALDIDVWQVRTSSASPVRDDSAVSLDSAHSTHSALGVDTAESPASAKAERPTSPSGHAGPAAAMALLADAQAGSVSAPSVQPSVQPAAPSAASLPSSTTASPTAAPAADRMSERRPPAAAAEPAVDLLCLAGPHGVLLAEFAGLSPAGNRLLNDILQAAMRLAAPSGTLVDGDKNASVKASKLRLQQLRFSWPPTDDRAALGAGASTGRALRGFLNRQLEDKENALLLCASSDVRTLLETIELSVDKQRILYIGEPEALLGDGAAKRALWQTLNTL